MKYAQMPEVIYSVVGLHEGEVLSSKRLNSPECDYSTKVIRYSNKEQTLEPDLVLNPCSSTSCLCNLRQII